VQSQSSIEATAQNSRWQTMLICRKPERIAKGRKKKPQTTDFLMF
jgi:hypothetical protein